MINEIVKSKMRMLYLSSAMNEMEDIIREAEDTNSSYLEFLNTLFEIELNGRTIKRIQRKIKQAGFPVIKTLSDFNFSIRPKLDKHKILSYCDGNFVEQKENLIFVGNPGVGKTHLGIAIAYELCNKDKRVWFTTGTGLINRLREARDEKVLTKYFNNAQKLDLVVIDEIGYFPYEKDSSELLFQYISERYERGSIIITTNLPFSKWNEIFHTQRLTTAILDRLVHHCHIIEMNGESFRFNQSVKKMNKKVKEAIDK